MVSKEMVSNIRIAWLSPRMFPEGYDPGFHHDKLSVDDWMIGNSLDAYNHSLQVVEFPNGRNTTHCIHDMYHNLEAERGTFG